MKKGILLVGAGGHARSCIEAIESAGLLIAGLIDQNIELRDQSVLGYPVLGDDDALLEQAKKSDGVLITIGQIGRPKVRMTLYERLAASGLSIVTVLASSSRVSRHATVERGSIVMHQAVVNAGARVGVNCIINTGAIIEHDCEIGNHCHVAIGAIIGGAARIGAGSFIGAGAIISHGVTIGPDSIISAGCVVMSDRQPGSFQKSPA